MNEFLGRVSAIARKEFIHIRRDPRTLISVLVMPILQLLLFAYAISFDVKDVPTIVLDADRTAQSREFVRDFQQSDFFNISREARSLDEVDAAFAASTARVAVIVPTGFGNDIVSGQDAEATVLVDGSEPNSAQLGQSYAIAMSQRLDRQVLVSWAEPQGLDLTAVGRAEPVVRTWYNPARRSADFLIPGLMVVIIMIVTIQQTAVTLVTEKDHGTLEQLLVSPLRRAELMLGKVLPWVILAFLDTVLITAVAVLVFQVPLRGDVFALALGMFLFVLCCLALGLLISARASSPEVANFAALMVSFLPGFMLSGFAFPLNSIPWFLQTVSYLFPGRYMVVISRGVFLKGADLAVLWPQIMALGFYAFLSLTIASLVYSRRL